MNRSTIVAIAITTGLLAVILSSLDAKVAPSPARNAPDFETIAEARSWIDGPSPVQDDQR